ncbi:hypothetical protein GGR54DRAFT_634643 [Hypoxylon sp. NC1633]|nr:hypothetical protein GGR54DRAFT_634643 [Hypoxylon sp. NC1633]
MFPNPEDQADYDSTPTGKGVILVVKLGRATGTTMGWDTEIESYTRTVDEYSIKETSEEMAVLPYGNANGPFSAPDDSGSILFDRKGRIFGMLSGGAGTTNEINITYLTPCWYIEDYIKKYFPNSFRSDVVG